MGVASSRRRGLPEGVQVHIGVHVPAPARTRMEAAKLAIYNFFHYTFTDRDGYALATFNDEYTLVDVGNGLGDARTRALPRMAELQPDGGTRLYDSIVYAIQDFQGVDGQAGFGDFTRPWVLIVLTDGDDNRSTTTAGAVGNFIRSQFMNQLPADQGNYVYVVGMGPDVTMASLRAMRPSGNFQTLHVRNFSNLQAELALIALRLYVGEEYAIQYVQAHGIEAVWAEVQDVVRVHQQEIDFMFLLDISNSMLLPA